MYMYLPNLKLQLYNFIHVRNLILLNKDQTNVESFSEISSILFNKGNNTRNLCTQSFPNTSHIITQQEIYIF